MSKLIVISSGSSGNGYILQCENESLVLECGMPLKDFEEAVNYKIDKWVGVFISHSHL